MNSYTSDADVCLTVNEFNKKKRRNQDKYTYLKNNESIFGPIGTQNCSHVSKLESLMPGLKDQ